MTEYARNERLSLADLFIAVGPDVPTLCAGWSTRDLAAHLVVRDRRPDATAGAMIPALAGRSDRIRRAAAAQPYPQLVDEVRRPPWWSPISNPLVHELLNTLEFFIHHEDVRRARPGWQPRTLGGDHQRALWSGARFTAKLALRRLQVPVAVRAPGFGTVQVGDGTPQVTLVGEPGELAMFLSGRQRAARVQVEGAPEAAERLRTAKLGR
jgi:uncharacterized protein (TIGR03085 family)